MNAPPHTEASKPERGKVWLVGAGPGDPGLITVKGLDCLHTAAVVVYDFLANPVLLEQAPPDCERICVGKRAGRHTLDQSAINQLLAGKAREGKNVCRLKGGDPFVFGRGGEEAAFLAAQGIPFEVVPGVTSAIAAPACAGIPLTHRGVANAFRVITGHEAAGEPIETDRSWANPNETLVFLMALKNIAGLCQRLIAAGRPPNTPAAVIASGTLPSQRTLLATLATLPLETHDAGIRAPALVVVGKAAALREHCAWFEKRPLFGHRILLTCAPDKTVRLATLLEAFGAEVVQAPMIRIEALGDSAPMREAVHNAASCHWCIFTSTNGVAAFAQALALEDLDARAFGQCRIAAVGPATADSLRILGLRADLVSSDSAGHSLLDGLVKEGSIQGQQVLWPRSEIARPHLADGLRAHNAVVREVPAYRTHIGGTLQPEVRAALEEGRVSLTVFTSPSAVQGFSRALASTPGPLPALRAAAIGPVTRQALEQAAIPIALTAETSTLPSLVESISRYLASGVGESPPGRPQ